MVAANDGFSRFGRSTIRQLMLVVAGVAVACALYQAGAFIAVNIMYAPALAAVAALPSRKNPRISISGFIFSAAWVNLSLPVLFAFEPVFHNWMLWFASALVCLPLAFGFGLAWVMSRPNRRRRVQGALAVAVLTAVPIATIATGWPLRLGFYRSSPALNRLADCVEAGGNIGPNEWAGIYPIRGWTALPHGGGTLLVIDPKPGDMAGFARSGGATGSEKRWDRLEVEGDGGVRWYPYDED
jgi:hypothetical protein